jgi:hypothetical protein
MDLRMVTNFELMKDEIGDLPEDSWNISKRRKNYFFQLLNVYRVSDDWQVEIRIAEPSSFEVEIAIAKLKSHK